MQNSPLHYLTHLRIGQGYDVHALVDNRPLILGGVHIPYHQGLQGHSDADVLTHAIIDALLGAAGMGDIGRIFPDNQQQYKNANSIELLIQVLHKIKQAHYIIINIDASIIAEQPKLSTHIPNIQNNLQQNIIQIMQNKEYKKQQNFINIKAKTNEGFGYLGQSQAIAVHANCLLLNTDFLI
jgi:2-C-methyl-D-erythritol 2,4-cyclodiphosphate synthase